MILAAALLVLVGLGLFVAGLLTGTTALYWACVAACVVAAVLLIAVRRSLPDEKKSATSRDARWSAGTERPVEQAPPPEAEPPAAPVAEARRSHAAPPSDAAATSVDIPAVRSARDEPTGAHAASLEPAAATAPPAGGSVQPPEDGEPPVEEVEVTDLLLVLDLHDEVLVVDEHPRYHLAGCPYLSGRATIPLPVDEARTDGFSPCGVCTPDRQLADRVRAKRSTRG